MTAQHFDPLNKLLFSFEGLQLKFSKTGQNFYKKKMSVPKLRFVIINFMPHHNE